MQPSPIAQRLAAVPELDRIAADPRCLVGLSKSTIAGLLLRSAVVQSALAAALGVVGDDDDHPENGQGADCLLGAKEAAARLAVTADYLYRNADKLPFTVRLGPGQLRFSSNGITRYIQTRQGRRKA